MKTYSQWKESEESRNFSQEDYELIKKELPLILSSLESISKTIPTIRSNIFMNETIGRLRHLVELIRNPIRDNLYKY